MEGFDKGKMDEKKEVVLAGLQNNLPIELLAKLTKLSIAEVQQIIDTRENKEIL